MTVLLVNWVLEVSGKNFHLSTGVGVDDWIIVSHPNWQGEYDRIAVSPFKRQGEDDWITVSPIKWQGADDWITVSPAS
jgi:hypothetical protein